VAALHPSERRPDLVAGFSGQGEALGIFLSASVLPGAQLAPEAAPVTPQPIESEVGGSQVQPARGSLMAVGIAQMELQKGFLGDVLSRRPLE
jgi:hypothetical protein